MSGISASDQGWVYLDPDRAISQVGDAQSLLAMLPMLQELLARDVPQIAGFLANDNVPAANALLHSLKGCMPIFCVPSICEEITRVEYMSKTGASQEVGAAYALLDPKLRQLQGEVDAYVIRNT
ncbi:MAG: Hpt domain-containing protein [Rhodoferax sp.]|jgi:hypothetical protein|nr:Hpt domain-containing protein [Rhodoferax sp.]